MRFSLLFVLSVAFVSVQAQDLSNLFQLEPSAASNYLKSYSSPMVNAVGNGMAGGWYNTAKPHKLLGFDLTLSVNAVQIPSEDEFFNFNSADYGSLEIAGTSDGSGQLPTLAGGKTSEQLQFTGDPITLQGPNGPFTYTPQTTPFDAPGGAFESVEFVPVPTLNLSIGLVKGTEIIGRYATLDNDDFSLNVIGFGIKHNIKQWIPGVKLLPFSLSALVAYSKFGMDFDLSSSDPNFRIENGTVDMDVSSFTAQIIASKKISVLTPYVAVGFNSVNGELEVEGDYIFTTGASSSQTLSDPVSINDFSGGGGLRASAGLRIKLAVITLHADYTLQKYSAISAGVGISVR